MLNSAPYFSSEYFRNINYCGRIPGPETARLPDKCPMDSQSTAKINQAVDAGLDRCAGTATPYSSLRGFLKELEETGNWTPDEIKTVDDAITRILGISP